MTPTGNTFTGSIDDNTGSFSIKGTLTNKIVELAADGFYFNEVSGSLSSAKLSLQAFSDLTDSSSVNVNLMTHLEKKRVEYLMDNSKMAFAAAKTQAQTEILKIFNIENVTLGNSEKLDISKSGDGNAVLLAISAILQSDKTEAELTELLSTINTDIRTDGTLDSTTTKATLVTAMEYLQSRHATIRSNIESRYSSLGISATIPAFESYAFKLDTTAPTVSSVSPANTTTSVSSTSSISVTFSEPIDNSTLSTNTSDTTCSGTIQISSDSFSTCIQMSSSTSSDNSTSDNSSSDNTTSITTTSAGNTIFNTSPSSSFSLKTTYKIRVTTGAKDLAGNTISSQYETATGFTTTGWKTLADMSIGRGEHASVVLNDKLYIIGGRLCNAVNCADPMTTSSVEMYDINTNTWENKASLPNDAGYLEAVTYNSKIYVLGGISMNGNGHETNRNFFLEYNPSSNSWTSLGTVFCYGPSCEGVVIGSNLYMIGRLDNETNNSSHDYYTNNNESNIKSLKAYDFGNSSWGTLASMNTGRANFGAAVYDSKIYVFGGRTASGFTNSVDVYDPSSNSWSNYTTIPSTVLAPAAESGGWSCDTSYFNRAILAATVGTKIVLSSSMTSHLGCSGYALITSGINVVLNMSNNSWSTGDSYSTNRLMYPSDAVAASSTKVYYSGALNLSSLSNKALFSYTP